MRMKTKISITLFVLLFFSVQTAPAFDDAVACYYSDKLKAGDEFTWATYLLIDDESYPEYLDDFENYGIANDSIAKLEILQSPSGINFHWDSFNASEYNDFFSLTLGGINLSYPEMDELYYWFIMYTRINYINGTTHNPTEDSWAYFVTDDFYFGRESAIVEITTQGNVVSYECSLEYDLVESIAFHGQIDKSNGVMLYFQADANYSYAKYSIIFEIQNYTPKTVSWSLSNLLLLFAVPIVLIKRRK